MNTKPKPTIIPSWLKANLKKQGWINTPQSERVLEKALASDSRPLNRGDFLKVRAAMIVKLRAEGESFEQIADLLSCDPGQVRLIWESRREAGRLA